MRYIIQSVTSGERAAYVKAKTEAIKAVFTATDVDEMMRADVAPASPVPLVPDDDLPTPNDEQASQLRTLMACVHGEIKRFAPFAEGEALISDRFSYLAEPFADMPAGTAALHRTTSQAELVYFFEDVQIVGTELRVSDIGTHSIMPAQAPPPPANLNPKAKEMAESLAKMIGTMLFDMYFPDNKVPPYFDEVLDRISEIVHNENLAQTIREMMGDYVGIMRFVNNEYEDEKAKQGVSKELLDRLQRKSDDMYPLVSRLMTDEETSLMGLSAFTFGATAHLAMLQEIAIQRAKLELPPDTSSSAKTFEEYADHLTATYDKLKTSRLDLIVRGDDYKCYTRRDLPDCHYWYFRLDKFDKSEGKRHSYREDKSGESETKAEAAATRDKEAHKVSIGDALDTDFDYPDQIANFWKSGGAQG